MKRRGAVPRHRRRLGRTFTRLWVGFTLASSGDGLLYGAVPLLAVVVNPHPFAVSAVIAADNLPWLLMALPAGHVADQFERGRVTVIANTLRAAAMLAGVALITTDRISLAILLALVLVNASGRAIYYSSFQAMVPGVIDSRDLEQANGVLTGTEASTEALAGPIAGTTLFAVAKSLPFVADAFVLLASCIPFARFHSKAPPEERSDSSSSMLEGMRLLLADRRLRILLLMVASLSALQGMEGGVLVLLATTEWGVRQGVYGLFLATGALGAIVGSFVADSIVRRLGGARALIGRCGTLRRGLPRHGLSRFVDARCPRLRSCLFCHRGRFSRCRLATSATDTRPPDGAGRKRVARHHLGGGSRRSLDRRCDRHRGDAEDTDPLGRCPAVPRRHHPGSPTPAQPAGELTDPTDAGYRGERAGWSPRATPAPHSRRSLIHAGASRAP